MAELVLSLNIWMFGRYNSFQHLNASFFYVKNNEYTVYIYHEMYYITKQLCRGMVLKGLINEHIRQLFQCLNEAKCSTYNKHVYQVRNPTK